MFTTALINRVMIYIQETEILPLRNPCSGKISLSWM